MRYEVRDTTGDPILIVPLEQEGITPRLAVRFTTADEDSDTGTTFIDMVLTDRMVTDLKQAMNRCIRESLRSG